MTEKMEHLKYCFNDYLMMMKRLKLLMGKEIEKLMI